MATLTVWKFDEPGGADEAEQTLVSLAKQNLITIHDAATVSWPADRKRPKTRQLESLTGAGALSGSFWGLLFGLLFFVPLLGMAVGAAAGATRRIADRRRHRRRVHRRGAGRRSRPGPRRCSCCRAMRCSTACTTPSPGQRPELVQSSLSGEEEGKLREVFAD